MPPRPPTLPGARVLVWAGEGRMCEGLLSVERAVCTWGPSPWGHPMLLLTLTLTLTLPDPNPNPDLNPTLEHYELRNELRYEKGIRNEKRAS